MKLDPVAGSSVIKAAGHDPATGKMRVHLHNGNTYEYGDVPLEKFAAFTGAASPGQYWNKRIKGAHGQRKVEG